MRLDPQDGKIIETREVRTDPEDIKANIATVRLKRERLRVKARGWAKEDEELKAYEDKLRAKLEAVGIDPLVDELEPMVIDVQDPPEPLSKFLDVRGRLRMDQLREARDRSVVARKREE